MCTFFWCHVLCPCPYEKDCALARNRIVFWDGMWRHQTAKQAPVPDSGTTCERRKDKFGEDAAPDWKCPYRDLLGWMVELTYVVDSKPCAECRHKCKTNFERRMEEEEEGRGRGEEAVVS
ncbi:hypothetical protein MKX07_003216 [Trichoderma sp. CBMAI-0711]|uniref:Uncharacterized protein n=1 Tax=Trichoderma parareesei TaxID=858221 RepID=A0A2H2ZU90_TRIPA|nr:hypothetical protein MKX07_003216 [Trichoderma sp. CBMAI-0711]OTA02844.1 hypothetical protein A9Z42_0032500 [Trichoderma parareesei]